MRYLLGNGVRLVLPPAPLPLHAKSSFSRNNGSSKCFCVLGAHCMPVRALDKDDLVFIANRYHEPYPTDRILRYRDERSHVINLVVMRQDRDLNLVCLTPERLSFHPTTLSGTRGARAQVP